MHLTLCCASVIPYVHVVVGLENPFVAYIQVMSESVACALEFLDNDGTQQTAFHPDGGQIFWLPKCEEPKHGCAEEKGEYRPNDEYLKVSITPMLT